MRIEPRVTQRRRRTAVASVAIAGLMVASCGGDSSEGDGAAGVPAPATTVASTLDPSTAAAALATYADVASSAYAAAVEGARAVRSTVGALLEDPTDVTLAAARQAWLDARPAYLHTEGFRFSGGPIDGTDENLEGFINAWPLDEVYVDSLLDGTEPLDEAALRAANERGGERNIATGWHAVEYLLWGVDTNVDGPGDRPVSEFVGAGRAERMRDYLDVATTMLVDDLTSVTDAWQTDGGAYRDTFVTLDPTEGLRRILTGIGTLAGGELYGQRLSVAYETKDQEEEHSCFSDNTTEDHIGDIESIRRIYLGLGGDGEALSGSSVSTLVAAVDPVLDTQIRDDLDAALAAARAIPHPFDQTILGPDSAPGRRSIATTIQLVSQVTDDLVDAAAALGVPIGTDVP